MALSDPRPEARVHVAAWVGTLAHAYGCYGGLNTTYWPSKERLRFATIPSRPDGEIRLLSKRYCHSLNEARRCLDRRGLDDHGDGARGGAQRRHRPH